MNKDKFTLEYPLNRASESILWMMIGSPLGLAEWFSDVVTVSGNEYTFSWNDFDQVAYLLEKKDGKSIRFQWEEDAGTEAYFEMEIITQDLSGSVVLQISDFADRDDNEAVEDMRLLWDTHIYNLRRKVGM